MILVARRIGILDRKLRVDVYKRQVVAGGGTAPINAIPAVRALCDTLEGDERTGAKIVLKALEAPCLLYTSRCV